MKRREFMGALAGAELMRRQKTSPDLDAHPVHVMSQDGITVQAWSEDATTSDMAVTLDRDRGATLMIVTVFYWVELPSHANLLRLLRSSVSVLPALAGMAVGVTWPIPVPVNQIDHVDVELVQSVRKTRLQ